MSSEQNKQTNLDKTAKLLVFSPPIFDESKRLSFSIPLTLLCLAACPKTCFVIDVQNFKDLHDAAFSFQLATGVSKEISYFLY